VSELPGRGGLAIGYNLGVVLFGGAGPLVATGLVETTQSSYAPAFYIAFGAVVSLAAAFLTPETFRGSLREGAHALSRHTEGDAS
jgi:MHS family proline/betaine transporter-like MFS transporter